MMVSPTLPLQIVPDHLNHYLRAHVVCVSRPMWRQTLLNCNEIRWNQTWLAQNQLITLTLNVRMFRLIPVGDLMGITSVI
jgi:hypothetical protein